MNAPAMPATDLPAMLTEDDLAAFLGVNPDAVHYCQRLEVGPPAVRIGSVWMWRRDVVKRWLSRGGSIQDDLRAAVAEIEATVG